MKAVVFGGGMGTRLRPMTDPLNKHLLQVGNKPMIYFVLETLAAGGVTQVVMCLNWKHPGLMLEMIETGEKFNLDVVFKYIAVSNGPMRQLSLTKQWIGKDPFVLMLGDSLYKTSLDFKRKPAPHMWTMPLNKVDRASKYSQVVVKGERVVAFREHPKEKFSNIIQTGAWVLPPDIFRIAENLESVTKGELRVSRVIKKLVDDGRMTCTMLPANSFLDLGTPEALLKGAQWVLQNS